MVIDHLIDDEKYLKIRSFCRFFFGLDVIKDVISPKKTQFSSLNRYFSPDPGAERVKNDLDIGHLIDLDQYHLFWLTFVYQPCMMYFFYILMSIFLLKVAEIVLKSCDSRKIVV